MAHNRDNLIVQIIFSLIIGIMILCSSDAWSQEEFRKDSRVDSIFGFSSSYTAPDEINSQNSDKNYSLVQMGLQHARGEGVDQDYKKAIEYFTEAANQNSAFAQFYLLASGSCL